jgi:hypothetical protein
MDLDVIRVPVAAVPVVADDDLRALPLEDQRKALGRIVEVGTQQACRVVVLRPAGHPGVHEAQPVDA